MDRLETRTIGVKQILSSRLFYLSALILISAALMDNYSGQKIQSLFPERQPIPDTLFDLLPYWQWTQYYSDIANIFSCILLAIYLFPKRAQLLPFVLSVLGIGYLIRSVVILLNPIGGPLGNHVHYGLTTIHQYGQIPSGHMFLVTAIYLFIDRGSPKLKFWALISLYIEGASLLLSHGHYSIDIIAGLALGYFSYKILEPRKAELTINA